MSVDYIPDRDSDLTAFANNFMNYYSANIAALGGLPADSAALATTIGPWSAALSALETAQRTVDEQLPIKAAARAQLVALLRTMARQIQARPQTTDGQRAALGLTIKDTARSASSAAAVAEAKPIAKVDTSNRLQHILDFRDADHQDQRAKPAGVKGCEIWMKVGEAPTTLHGGQDPEDMRFLALDTATPYAMHFGQVDAGKDVYYAVRWVASDGTKGPWGETVVATVVG